MTLKCAAPENEPICAYLRTLETQYARSNPGMPHVNDAGMWLFVPSDYLYHRVIVVIIMPCLLTHAASKFRFTIKRAITSLTQHPAPIRHGTSINMIPVHGRAGEQVRLSPLYF